MHTGGETGTRFAVVLAGALLALASVPAIAAGMTTTPHRPGTGAAGTPNPPGVAWCADYRLGALSEQERMHGTNLMRLRAAENELAPGFAPGSATTGLRLLADYQEELGKAHPDVSVAASYLAQVSTVPITATRYLRVNALLCVSTTRALAQKIETGAEAQRERMAR